MNNTKSPAKGPITRPAVAAFDFLLSEPRWVAWRFVRRGKDLTKVPFQSNGKAASSTNPATWATAMDLEGLEGFDGMGIVLVGDGIGGIDLDHCRNPQTGEIDPWAAEIIARFNSYSEVSPSGTGVKILARGAPESLPGNKYTPSGVEPKGDKVPHADVYLTGRYFTITGEILPGSPDEIRDAGPALTSAPAWGWLSKLLTPKPAARPESAPTPLPSSAVMDDALLARMEASKQVARLWREGKDGGGDRSANDLALASTMSLVGFSPAEIRAALEAYPQGQIGSGKLQGKDAERQLGRLIQKAQAAQEPPPWDREPEPLEGGAPEPLPLEKLPDALRRHIRSVAGALQVPEDLPAALALGVLSASVAGKVRVAVRSAWSEPVQIWTAAILPSGARKSPTFKTMLEPLVKWELETVRRLAPKVAAAGDELEIAQKTLAILKDKRAKDPSSVSGSEIFQARERVEELKAAMPHEGRILLGDVTADSMVMRLAAQKGVGAIMEPEPDLFKGLLSGRYDPSKGGRLAEVNKGYDGERFLVDRVGRGGLDVHNPALTLTICLQPGIIESLEQKGAMRDQGTLARFLWVYPPDSVGRRLTGKAVPPLDLEAQRDYAKVIENLLEARDMGPDALGAPTPHLMRLAPEAVSLLEDFEARLERSMGLGEENEKIRDWASKAMGRAVRIAVLLEAAERAANNQPPFAGAVGAWAMEAALEITWAALSHARLVLGAVAGEARLRVRVLDAAIEVGDETGTLTLRDLHQKVKGSSDTKSVNQVQKVVEELKELGCVRTWRGASTPQGGAPPNMVQVHPSLLKKSKTPPKRAPEPTPEAGWDEAAFEALLAGEAS